MSRRPRDRPLDTHNIPQGLSSAINFVGEGTEESREEKEHFETGGGAIIRLPPPPPPPPLSSHLRLRNLSSVTHELGGTHVVNRSVGRSVGRPVGPARLSFCHLDLRLPHRSRDMGGDLTRAGVKPAPGCVASRQVIAWERTTSSEAVSTTIM